MTTQIKVLTDEEKKEVDTSVSTYVDTALYSMESDKVFNYPQQNKVAYLQVTRKGWKKSRELGSVKNDQGQWEKQVIEYIPVRKLERLLNFLFNFSWDSELVDKEFCEVETTTNKGKSTVVYHAYVVMKFTANFLGRDITRTVSGSFQMYENKATSKFAVIQAAISQSKRNFAKEFGIGADLNDEDITTEERLAAIKKEKDNEAAKVDLPEGFEK